ncbi:MAG: PAS domain S-box protein [Bacteroidia bacterium]|nr:PAS domain S-box protein [Bacteroidia bacterium]
MSVAIHSARVRRQNRIVHQQARVAYYAVMGVVAVICLAFVYAVFRASGGEFVLPVAGAIIGSVVLLGVTGVVLFNMLKLVGAPAAGGFTLDRKSSAKAQVTEGKYKSLIQNSLDIITILDGEGLLQYVSPSSERVLGYQADNLLGQPIFELVHQEDHPLLRNALSQKSTFFFSFRMQHRDGSWLYFESSGTNMLADPLIKGIVLNSRDITDRKKEEEEKKQKELAALRFNKEREMAERERAIIQEEKKKLDEAYGIIEHKQREITDSIQYAFRIQTAMLPDVQVVRQVLPESFIFWRPKDIVSGDFYWFSTEDNYTLITAADCTGHGVPGAFMTMIGNTLLNLVVKQLGYRMPHEVLFNLHKAVRRALRQDQAGSKSNDGMDMSFAVIEHDKGILHWAGANNPLILIRGGEIHEYKADKRAIGGAQVADTEQFSIETITMQAGDVYYLFTDGFQDQFGGDKGRKYMTKRFKELLRDISPLAPDAQREKLDTEILGWMGADYEQVDDVLVVGFKV